MRTAEYYGPAPAIRLAALETALAQGIRRTWREMQETRRDRCEIGAYAAQVALVNLLRVRREAREAVRS